MRVVRTLAVLAAVTGMSSGAAPATGHGPHMSVYAPANRCFALQVGGTGVRFVAARGRSYAASAPSRARATAFYLKPAGLGTYMLYDSHARLMSAGAGGNVARSATAGPATEFALTAVDSGSEFTLRSTADHGRVVATGGRHVLALTRAAGTSRPMASSASGWAPTPTASAPCRVPAPTPGLIPCATRFTPMTAV